jgi:transposase-like protein
MPPAASLRTLVESKGSIRQVALALGLRPDTLRRWVVGERSTPDGIAAAVRRLRPVGVGRPGRKLQLRDAVT